MIGFYHGPHAPVTLLQVRRALQPPLSISHCAACTSRMSTNFVTFVPSRSRRAALTAKGLLEKSCPCTQELQQMTKFATVSSRSKTGTQSVLSVRVGASVAGLLVAD